jgi:DNA-binding CsgD family transcriptional regulator
MSFGSWSFSAELLGQPVRTRVELGRVPSRFAALALVFGALVLTVLATRVVDAWFVQLMLDHAATRAADEVQLGLVDRVTPADFAPPYAPERLDDLAARLDPVLGRVRNETSGILRVNIVARDGTILYSDLTALRGRMVSPTDKVELKTALQGSVGADAEPLSGEENADLRLNYSAALEVYVPVRLGGDVVGAYEIYQELGPVQVVRVVLWGAVIGLWCIVLAGVYVVRHQRGAARVSTAHVTPPPPSVGRATNGRDLHIRLTRRELQVLRLMATSHTNRDIAEQLVVSEETIRSHVKRILRKLDQPDRTQAVVVAVRAGLIELPDQQPSTFHPIG